MPSPTITTCRLCAILRTVSAKTEPKPIYKQADAGDLAKAVAKEVGKTMLPTIILGVVLVGLIVYLIVR